MSGKRPSFTAVAAVAVRETVTHPSYWLPALLLLAPTLVLQLAAPTYLRTRLAPSAWIVGVGAVLLVWLAQVALPAICALVHARRAGMRPMLDWPLVRLSLVIGTRVTLGFAAVVLPGLWLQARYAFAPLPAGAGNDAAISSNVGARQTRVAEGRLLLVASVVLLLSVLGQSGVAALAEGMSTITPAGDMNGRTAFQLNFLPHALTTVGAYAWNATLLTFYALCVSELFDEVRGIPSSRQMSAPPHRY